MLGLLFVAALWLSGCGQAQHNVDFAQAFKPVSGTRVEVGQVTNDTGKTFEVDAVKMLTDAFVDRLQKNNLLWSGGQEHRLILSSKIIDYEQGNAFKRWLLPGYGSTVLKIEGELRDGQQIVATHHATHSVSFGGGYTIGAWRTIFNDVAEEIVQQLAAKLK
jgi:hypothetical protein